MSAGSLAGKNGTHGAPSSSIECRRWHTREEFPGPPRCTASRSSLDCFASLQSKSRAVLQSGPCAFFGRIHRIRVMAMRLRAITRSRSCLSRSPIQHVCGTRCGRTNAVERRAKRGAGKGRLDPDNRGESELSRHRFVGLTEELNSTGGRKPRVARTVATTMPQRSTAWHDTARTSCATEHPVTCDPDS